jgi:putative heme-binding domain-containing protein
MSREVIEAIHIPLDVVKHLDLKRGRNQGRIYRIAPPGFRYQAPPRLSQATTAELVAALARPDAWYRDTAHRLIFERQDPAAIEPLRRLLKAVEGHWPAARVHVLWSLEGLKALSDEDIRMCMGDPAPEVRAQAVQLAAGRLDHSPRVLEAVLALADDPDSRVRFRVAFALGETRDPRAEAKLVQIVLRDVGNRWIRAAVLSSCAATAGRLWIDLWRATGPKASRGDSAAVAGLLRQLAEVVGARNRPDEAGRVLEELAAGDRDGRTAPGAGRSGLRDELVLVLARAARRSGGLLAIGPDPAQPGAALVAGMARRAREQALDERATEPARLRAIAVLSALEPDASRGVWLELIEPRHSQAVQVAAVQALAQGRATNLAEILLPRLRALEPSVRAAAVQALLSRAAWTTALLRTLQGRAASGLSPALIDPSFRAPLLQHRDPEIARLAQALFGQAAGSRASVLVDYLPAARNPGDVTRGAKVFARECQSCHKVGDRGFALGPDLTGSPSSDPAALLTNILDPNASVQPDQVQYVVVDQDGRTYAGLLAAETATSLTLHRGDGAADTILRAQVAAMTSTGLSLMPEGFEKTISKPEMADLIAFLRAAHRGGSEGSDGIDAAEGARPLDIGTLPGLIEPD